MFLRITVFVRFAVTALLFVAPGCDNFPEDPSRSSEDMNWGIFEITITLVKEL